MVPEWPSQDWFGFLHDTCTSFELFPAEDGLFLLHGVHSQPSPPWNVLAFHFVDFSWTHVQLQFASSTDLAHSQAASSFDYMAGLIISFNSTTLCYLVKYTDGTTATLTADVVKTLLLPPDPVGVSD